MDLKAMKFRIKGRVQGVGYRAWAQRKGTELGLSGWVRNLPDGSVEAFAQGPQNALENFAAQCQVGPPIAKVESVQATHESAEKNLVGFEFRKRAMNQLSLIIPVFNERGNLLPLAQAIEAHRPPDLLEVIWVNNGCSDGSHKELEEIQRCYSWSRVKVLGVNQGYGGGVLAGVMTASLQATHLGWIPADGQVDANELFSIWEKVKTDPASVHKGIRVKRKDSSSQKAVSQIYSHLTRLLLGIPSRDTNGLPKIFPAALLRESCFHNPETTGFVFDASMLYYAIRKRLKIVEHPVSFLRRRSGQSSWSGRRLATYLNVTSALLRLRARRKMSPDSGS